MGVQKFIPKNQKEMDLLDKFAGIAMKSLIAHHGAYCDDTSRPYSVGKEDVYGIAEYAYVQAEAIMEVRKHRYNW